MEEIDDSELAFINDCMFYLKKDFDNFFKNYNITIEIIEEKYYDWFDIKYILEIIINNNIYNFTIYESLNEKEVPIKLSFHYGVNYYFGGNDIFNKIINIINNDLIKLINNEINQIENLIKKEEILINRIDFQIKSSAYLMSKFNIPVEITLLCF